MDAPTVLSGEGDMTDLLTAAPISTKITATDIRAALMKFYAPPGHRVLFEVSNDTGARAGRWIDALAFGIWPSTGHEIVGIEIKISRGDWKRELAMPEKAQALMRYCTRWFVAAPAGLIKPDELPATWGMLSFKDGAVKITTPAKLLDPEQITPGFMMAAMRMCHAVDPELVNKIVTERLDEARKSIDREIQYGIDSRVRDNSSRMERAVAVAERVRAITGVDIHDWSFDEATLACAYHFLKLTGLHSSVGYGAEIPGIINSLESALDGLKKMKDAPAFVELQAISARAREAEHVGRARR